MSPPPSLRTQLVSGTVPQFCWYVLAPIVIPALVAVPFVILSATVVSETVATLLALPFVLGTCILVLASLGLRRYPLTAFGTHRTVEEELFVRQRTRCAECDGAIDRGENRRYAEQVVAFGYPLYTTDHGENAYCPWCADGLESPLREDAVVETGRSGTDEDGDSAGTDEGGDSATTDEDGDSRARGAERDAAVERD